MVHMFVLWFFWFKIIFRFMYLFGFLVLLFIWDLVHSFCGSRFFSVHVFLVHILFFTVQLYFGTWGLFGTCLVHSFFQFTFYVIFGTWGFFGTCVFSVILDLWFTCLFYGFLVQDYFSVHVLIRFSWSSVHLGFGTFFLWFKIFLGSCFLVHILFYFYGSNIFRFFRFRFFQICGSHVCVTIFLVQDYFSVQVLLRFSCSSVHAGFLGWCVFSVHVVFSVQESFFSPCVFWFKSCFGVMRFFRFKRVFQPLCFFGSRVVSVW
jgi:hypothetical protein